MTAGYDPPLHSTDAPNPATVPSRDRFAIAGFVLALIAWATLGVAAIPGIIFSGIAYGRREEYSGRMLMLWGFWLNFAALAFYAMVWFVIIVHGAQGGSYSGGPSA
jgi:hypothetical protein